MFSLIMIDTISQILTLYDNALRLSYLSLSNNVMPPFCTIWQIFWSYWTSRVYRIAQCFAKQKKFPVIIFKYSFYTAVIHTNLVGIVFEEVTN